jgi:hypothetical protein
MKTIRNGETKFLKDEYVSLEEMINPFTQHAWAEQNDWDQTPHT